MLTIPLDATNDRYRLTVTLDGQDVGLRCYWLPRCAGWYLDLEHPDGEPIATGRRITPGAVVAFPGAGDGVPPGRFVARGPDRYGRDDLGTQVFVDYLTLDEVEAAQ